jgi:hypothetical protein
VNDGEDQNLRTRLTAQAEEALGRFAQDVLDNPLVHGALRSAFEAREKALAAQEVAMGALNLPSASDIERLTRRLRSVSQRLEGIEDGVDRVDRALASTAAHASSAAGAGIEVRLAAIEASVGALSRQVAELAERLPGDDVPVSLAQERLQVEDAPGSSRRRSAG